MKMGLEDRIRDQRPALAIGCTNQGTTGHAKRNPRSHMIHSSVPVSSAAHARTIRNRDMTLGTSVASLVNLALLLDQMPKLANNSHNNEGNIQDQCTVFLSDQRLNISRPLFWRAHLMLGAAMHSLAVYQSCAGMMQTQPNSV
jgi:hypothetical protein